MVNENLPNIVSTLSDRNLDTQRFVDLGDSVLIIGTSARGPVNQPVKIYNPQDAENIFGPITSGNLVRGFSEVYYGPNGVKDIRLCRISNGKKAKAELVEAVGTVGTEDYRTVAGVENTPITALTVEAIEPGDVYNQISFRQDLVNGQLTIVCFNPITGLETQIAYDPTGTKAGAVSDVAGLANAINLDPNIGSIVVATANEINIAYSLTITDADVAASGTFAEDANGTLIVDLGTALDDADANDDGVTDDTSVTSPSGIQVTAGNRIIRLNEVYELVDLAGDTAVELNSAGYASVQLPYPSQTESGVAAELLALDGQDTGGMAKHKVVNAYIGAGDDSKVTFEFTAYEAIDPATFKLYRTSSVGTTVEITSGYTLDSVGGVGKSYVASVTLDSTHVPPVNAVMTVTYDSEEFALTQSASLQACKASNSYKEYFIAGDMITFGTAQPSDMVIAYSAQKIYEIDVDVVVYDAKEGKIQFCNTEMQPDYVNGSTIYIDYDYQPEWIDLTSAVALQRGSNGIQMNNKTKYQLLDDAYVVLEDYSVDCIVLMNTYFDDTKVIYDEETGLPVEVNAGFVAQFETFLTSLQDGVNETYGIMSVRPASSPKAEDVATWLEKLTVASTLNVTRGANIMAATDARHVNVVAFEPVIANNSISIPYSTTGEAVYAGIVCKLPVEKAPTYKDLGTQVLTCRFKLSPRQLDELTANRFVSSRLMSDNSWVITDAMTAAAPGSDYSRFSTFRIVCKTMDVVRSAAKPFLGNLFGGAQVAALETAITKGLLSMKEPPKEALRNFDFKIEQTSQERALGIARVPLTLWPNFELRRIEVTVKLSNS